jgi:replicative DNA helicase
MSRDNEQRLVVTLLSDYATAYSRLDGIATTMFTDKDSRTIFEAIVTSHEEGESVDHVDIANRIGMKLSELSDYIDQSYSAPDAIPIDCSEIIAEWQQREITSLMQSNIAIEDNPTERASNIKAKIDDILTTASNTTEPFSETINKWRDGYSEWYDGKRPQGIKTGYWFLDMKLRYKPGNLITIGARTGVGKTTFALNQSMNIARGGTKVGLISLEMSADELVDKFLGISAGYSPDVIYNKKSFAKIMKESVRIVKYPITINAPLFNDAQKVFNIVRKMVSNGAGVVFIDYLQLLFYKGNFQNRNYEIGKITSSLKTLASELKIPIVILSQLKRRDGNPAPELSDLRDSGSIEQDSNIVIFLHQKEVAYSETAELQCRIAKNRGGGIGLEDVIFRKDISLITAKDEIHEFD